MSDEEEEFTDDIFLGKPISRPFLKEKGSKDILTFAGLVSFTTGTLNGTRSLKSKNMTICEKKLISKVDKNVKLMWNNTLDGNYFKIGWAFLDMLYNIDPIT